MTATVATLRAELRTDSDDVASPTPRLSWTTDTDVEGWTQAGAEIELDGRETAIVNGRDSVLVPWPFAPLEPRAIASVRVRVTGSDGETSEWSGPRALRAAFLAEGEWVAPFVGLAGPAGNAQPGLLRTEFEVRAGLTRAVLYATARGSYQVEINGSEVDDQVLKPGWTPYQYRLVHETTDVTGLLNEGANGLGIGIAGAWYTESFGFGGNGRAFYGDQPSAAVQLRLDYADGSTETVVTGPDWRASAGPITASGIYYGEDYDARAEQPGWSSAGFDDSAWTRVRVDDSAGPIPTVRTGPAVRVLHEVPVKNTIVSASGGQILDFGQNLVGRLRIRVNGPAGTVVTLRHAEVLEHGELGTRPLRYARATDTYVLHGDSDEVWEPRFTFHGFRYAEVTGLPEPIDPAAVTARVIHSDMRRTGWFESSHALLNQLHENVVWGMRGNFLYLPTDCPQRDERLGWTGDIEVFAPTASFLYDADGFLSSWLEDLALDQAGIGEGIVPFVVPNVLGDGARPAAAWGDAATIVPSVLYERFGDTGILAAQFESMKAWADQLLGRAGERMLWEGDFQFGDWLDPTAPPEDPAAAKTDTDIVATAYLFRSTDLVAKAAAVLGEEEEAARYAGLAERVRQAFLRQYVTPGGRMMSDAQTGYATALMFGIVTDEETRTVMGDRLEELVRTNGYRIGTGFVGTPLVTDALESTGHLDAAARLLTETRNPSWLYPVTMGATTVWERWDSMLEDGTINPGEMTSFNHYALGAVADWLHRSVAGLAPAEPGYRTVRIAPRPIEQLEDAEARLDGPYGRVRAAWRRDGDSIVVEATVPANTSAEVVLPGSDEVITVGSGEHSWDVPAPARKAAPGPIDAAATSLAQLIDDRVAYDAVLKAVAESAPDDAEQFPRGGRWSAGTTVQNALQHTPPVVRAAAEKAIAELNATR
jgi:alpha-L-rhamnosidase